MCDILRCSISLSLVLSGTWDKIFVGIYKRQLYSDLRRFPWSIKTPFQNWYLSLPQCEDSKASVSSQCTWGSRAVLPGVSGISSAVLLHRCQTDVWKQPECCTKSFCTSLPFLWSLLLTKGFCRVGKDAASNSSSERSGCDLHWWSSSHHFSIAPSKGLKPSLASVNQFCSLLRSFSCSGLQKQCV